MDWTCNKSTAADEDWSNVPLGTYYLCQSVFMLAVYIPCFIAMLSAELQVSYYK